MSDSSRDRTNHRKLCIQNLRQARLFAERGNVERMQHVHLSSIDGMVWDNPALKAEMQAEYDEVAKLGYINAVRDGIKNARRLMSSDRWNEADKTLLAVQQVFAEKAGMDCEKIERICAPIYDDYHRRHRTSSAYL